MNRNQQIMQWLADHLRQPLRENNIAPAVHSKTPKPGRKASVKRWWHKWQTETNDRFPHSEGYLKELEHQGWRIVDLPERERVDTNYLLSGIAHELGNLFPQVNQNTKVVMIDRLNYGRTYFEPIHQTGNILSDPPDPWGSVAQSATVEIELQRIAIPVELNWHFDRRAYHFVMGYSGYSDTLYAAYLGD